MVEPSRGVVWGLAAVALGAGAMFAYQKWGPPRDSETADLTPDEPGAIAKRWPAQEVLSSKAKGVRRIPPVDDGDPGMLSAMKRAIGEDRGRIAFLGERERGDKRFGSLERRIRTIDPDPFAQRDSRAALAALREVRADWLLVSQLQPRILPWLSPTATTIRELLRDGVPPPHFHPRVIGRAHILYRIAPPLELSAEEKADVTQRVRARLAGEDVPPLEIERSAEAVGADGHHVLVALRGAANERTRGRPIASGSGRADTLLAAIDAATDDAREAWSSADRRGLDSDLDDALGGVRVQIDVATNMADVTDRDMDADRLFRMFEIGREGVTLSKGKRFWYVGPQDGVHRAIDDEKTLVERVGEAAKLGKDAWKNRGHRFGRFETVSWIERAPGRDVVSLYRGLPLVTFRDVTRERLVESLRLGAKFLVRNQYHDGQFRYLYKPMKQPAADRWSNENNIVRHGLNPYTVLLVHGIEPDPAYVEAAHKGLGFTIKHLKRVENRCYVEHQDDGENQPNVKMGTVAVTILSMLKLKEFDDITRYESTLRCLGEELLAMQKPSGDVTQYDVPEGHPSRGRRNTIFPGEIMFAFSRMYGHTQDERFKRAFDRLRDFQERWFAQNEAETTDDDIYDETHRVDLISFEPWGLMALDDMHRQTGDDAYVDWAFHLVEFMDGRFQFDLERSQYPDFVGGYFKTQLELPAINSCGYSEGAAAAFGIAVRTGRKVEERRRAIVMGLRFALQLQYPSREMSFYVPDPDTALGGYRYNLNKSRVRNDYMYHAMSALAQGVLNLRPQDYPARTPIAGIPEILREVAGE